MFLDEYGLSIRTKWADIPFNSIEELERHSSSQTFAYLVYYHGCYIGYLHKATDNEKVNRYSLSFEPFDYIEADSIIFAELEKFLKRKKNNVY